MIVSPKYKICYLPIERTGSQTIETLLKGKDPDLYRRGEHRHGRASVPRSYKLLVSRRNPLDRFASFYSKSKTNDYMGFGKFFTSFEEFLHFISANQHLPFLDDPEGELFAPHNKWIQGELVQLPIPEWYYLQDLTPDLVVNYESYEADVRALPFVDPGDDVPRIDGTTWDITELAFEGMEQLALAYDRGAN